MSITETTSIAPQKPKRKTKARRKRAAPSPAAPKPASFLAGITVVACPAACNEAGCVISGKPYCGHPHKGGLQGRDMSDEAAKDRFLSAKKMLGKAKVNLEKQ